MRKDGLTCRIGACPSYNGNFHVTIYKFTTGKYKNDANVLQCSEYNYLDQNIRLLVSFATCCDHLVHKCKFYHLDFP